MKILEILAHPDPESFNAALAFAVREALGRDGHQVWFHDLYAEDFDPRLEAEELPKDAPLPSLVETHCQELEQADGIVVVHPNWWGMPPALLAGWIDRVLRPGRAYEFLEGDSGQGVPQGLLPAQAALVLNTGDTDPQREARVFGDPLERIWKDCVFGLCGVSQVERRYFTIMVTSTLEQRQAWLGQAVDLARRLFPPA